MSTGVLSGTGALSPAQVASFHEQGFLVVRGVFSRPEMALVSMEADRLCERKDLIHSDNIRCRWQNHVGNGECLFECFDPVIDLSSLCADVARDPRLISLLSQLYGEPAHLFKDKLIFKPPGAKGYDLHQDFIAWPTFPRSFTTTAVAIDPCGRENGATEVFPGMHSGGCLSREDGDYHSLPPELVDGRPSVFLELQPGDVAIFGAFAPHRSAPNQSDDWRRLLYLSYNSHSDGGEQRDRHYQEFHAWLKMKYAEYGKHNVYFR